MKAIKGCLIGLFVVLLGLAFYGVISGVGVVPGIPSEQSYAYPEYPDYDASEYVKLGDYEHLSVSVDPLKQVDETVLDEQTVHYLIEANGYKEVTEGTVANDQRIRMTYDAYVDGSDEKDENLSYKDDEIVVGSNTMVDGFEAELVGMTVGKAKEFTITFPEDWQDSNYAGKNVKYSCTVTAILENPEVTDEAVKEASDGKYADVAALKADLTKSLEENYQEAYEDRIDAAVKKQVLEVSEVSEIPDELMDWYVNTQLAAYNVYAEQTGVSLDTMVQEQAGVTVDEFAKAIRENEETVNELKQDLAVRAMGLAMNVEVSDEDYDKQIEEYAEYVGMSVEDYLNLYTESSVRANIYVTKTLEAFRDSGYLTVVDSAE